ncbi:DNA polymerase IV [Flavilitoribacter nigricans]|uniref:DNA polymerase IV n=1 Tax=Flavilitoribacter nigricans (strain ATCC 23147 / DSM 23189 / NBRC 102662 / NCIMB 1420 / SS-2) TaxID=1122177 RepID=A0A2D0MZW3_FLAN2|nr:DNA polymerase IV [Flavilitoribacter nigricans]PHN01757.1 DNA polymerase IV [Flavilitoribacter nigricans DSM 23189 = NBRC 102662]
MYQRAVLHLDMDTFFVSVERKYNSELLQRPVIIGGGSNRGVVSSSSYEARRFGVRSGMPMALARRFCPEAVYLRGDMDLYSRESRLITDIITEQAPVFSKNSIDEFDIDLSGMDRYLGVCKWSRELRHRIMRESGLPVSSGISANRFVSKMATNAAKPCNEKQIPPGDERPFLAPIHIAKMHGVGEVNARKLIYMGIRHIGTLSKIPRRLLQREFGKYGDYLWERANGIDPSVITPYRREKSISRERTFQTDSIDPVFLRAQLLDMCSRLGFQLRDAGKLASCVTVKIRYSDFQTYTQQRKIPYTANDRDLRRQVEELFRKLYQRRQRVRLVGVKLSGLVSGSFQISLLDDTAKEIELLLAMDRIRKRFGETAVRYCDAMMV